MSEEKGRSASSSIRLHLVIGLAVIVVLAGGLGGWASTAQISGALIAPGAIVVDSNVKKVQHPTGGVVGEVRARDGTVVKAGDIVVRLDDTVTKASLAIVTKSPQWIVGAGGAAGGRAAGPRQTHLSPDAARPRRRSRRQERDGERRQAVRGADHRAGRTKGAVARARRTARRRDRRPDRAGDRQDQGTRAGREGTGRRSLAVRAETGADFAADGAGARPGAAGRRARAVSGGAGAGQGQDHRDRIADHPGRQGSGQRGFQGFARDQRQDRRIRRAQGHRRRSVAAHRHPRAAGRHGAAVHGAYRRRRDHRRRRHHDDRAAEPTTFRSRPRSIRRISTSCRSARRRCCGCRRSTSAPRRN